MRHRVYIPRRAGLRASAHLCFTSLSLTHRMYTKKWSYFKFVFIMRGPQSISIVCPRFEEKERSISQVIVIRVESVRMGPQSQLAETNNSLSSSKIGSQL